MKKYFLIYLGAIFFGLSQGAENQDREREIARFLEYNGVTYDTTLLTELQKANYLEILGMPDCESKRRQLTEFFERLRFQQEPVVVAQVDVTTEDGQRAKQIAIDELVAASIEDEKALVDVAVDVLRVAPRCECAGACGCSGIDLDRELEERLKDETAQCPICMDDDFERFDVQALCCKTLYHRDCLLKWGPSCPICRKDECNLKDLTGKDKENYLKEKRDSLKRELGKKRKALSTDSVQRSEHVHGEPSLKVSDEDNDKRVMADEPIGIHRDEPMGIHREKPFPCGLCSKRCATRLSFIAHMRNHTLDKPYACSHQGCRKAFNEKDHLKRHMRIHTQLGSAFLMSESEDDENDDSREDDGRSERNSKRMRRFDPPAPGPAPAPYKE